MRLAGDQYFLHRLCQLLFFCLIFRRKAITEAVKDGPVAQRSQEEKAQRVGVGNGGVGYTYDEVKNMFMACLDLCKKTHSLPSPVPSPGTSTGVGLHYPDGQVNLPPEEVEKTVATFTQVGWGVDRWRFWVWVWVDRFLCFSHSA